MNMNGWDTIFAANVAYANRALAQNSAAVLQTLQASFSGSLGTFNLSIQFGPWQVVPGGSGKLIKVLLPITSGTFECPNGQTYPLAGCQPIMQFSLALQSTGNSGAGQQLQFLMQQAGQLGQPGAPGFVTPMGFAQQPSFTDAVLQTIFLNTIASGLVQKANEVSFAFASIQPSAGGSSWLTPRNCAFSYYEPVSGQAGYLIIFSTGGSATSLPPVADPTLFSGSASFAISLPLFLQNVTLPSLVSSFPHAVNGEFVVTSTGQLVLTSGSQLELGAETVGLITYYPSVKSLLLTPGNGVMSVAVSGDCDLYGDCSMTFNVTANNQFSFTQSGGTCSFLADSNASVKHDTSVPWWYLGGGLLAYGIANTVAAIVAANVADLVGGKVGSNTLAAVPPVSLQFAGMQQFTPTNAFLNGALVIQGH
jgi:Clostridium P-47 protein